MKRPVNPKQQQTSRPKLTTRASVRIRKPAGNQSGTTRPAASTR